MSHTYEKLSGNKAKLTFTIPAEQFDEAMQQAFLKLRKRVNVPGFRKGKAPRRMIETLYGESIFYDDAFEIIFPDAYRAAVEEYDPDMNAFTPVTGGENDETAGGGVQAGIKIQGFFSVHYHIRTGIRTLQRRH